MRMDGRDEDNSRFSQIRERAKNSSSALTVQIAKNFKLSFLTL